MLPGLLSSSTLGPRQGQDSHSLGASPRAVHTEGTWPVGLKSSYSASGGVLWPRTVSAQRSWVIPLLKTRGGHIFLICLPFL